MTGIRIAETQNGAWEYIPAGGMALTAEQVEDVRALVWLDGRRNFDAFYRLRALFPATEPAEAHCTVPPEGWWCSRAANHDGPCAASEGVAQWVPQPLEADWLDQVDPRDPQSRTHRETAAAKFAEPAEEETKAERDSQGIIRINGGRIVALSRDPRELVQQWYDLAEPGSKWQRYYAAALDLFDREAVSSPVVPAPTETGPWQTWQEVPEGVKYKSSKSFSSAVWFNQDHNRYASTPDGERHLSGVDDSKMNTHLAPFVAAEEG